MNMATRHRYQQATAAATAKLADTTPVQNLRPKPEEVTPVPIKSKMKTEDLKISISIPPPKQIHQIDTGSSKTPIEANNHSSKLHYDQTKYATANEKPEKVTTPMNGTNKSYFNAAMATQEKGKTETRPKKFAEQDVPPAITSLHKAQSLKSTTSQYSGKIGA